MSQDVLHLKRSMWFCLRCVCSCVLWPSSHRSLGYSAGVGGTGRPVAPSVFTRRSFSIGETNASGEKKQNLNNRKEGRQAELCNRRLVCCIHSRFFFPVWSLTCLPFLCCLLRSLSVSFSLASALLHTCLQVQWLKLLSLHASAARVLLFTQLSGPGGPCPAV